MKSTELDRNQALSPYQKNGEVDCDDPFQQFTYALKTPKTKKQYPKRLQIFMEFANIEGDLKRQAKNTKRKTQDDPEWFNDGISVKYAFLLSWYAKLTNS